MELPSLDLVKIDVEGAEPEVLNGMDQTIAADHPILLIEFLPKYWDYKPETVLSSLSSRGYSFYAIEDGVVWDPLEVADVVNQKSSIHDLLAVPRTRLINRPR